MSGTLRSYLRLLAVQGAWNYERMLGVGMGYSATPLLRELARSDPDRYKDAVVRSAEFFNAHPYLAGLALGASVRAEYEQVPGAQVARLRTTLCSPLGALGDQVFWSGLVPALISVTLIALALGAGWWTVGAAFVIYAAVRLATGWWALRTGLAAGMGVAQAIAGSWLPAAARWLGPAAAFLVGAAVPVTAAWLWHAVQLEHLPVLATVVVVGLGLSARFSAKVTAVRFALAALLLTLVWQWTIR